MKRRTVKPPVDDLFARKLGNMSLPPDPDGFARLQSRMGGGEPRTQRVFWHNPTNQRYSAIAACFLLVCLFGWLYLSTEAPVSEQRVTVATNKPRLLPVPKQTDWKSTANQRQVVATRPSSEQKMNGRISPQLADRHSTGFGEKALDKAAPEARNLATINPAAHDKQITPQNTPMTIPGEQVAKPILNTLPAEPTSEPQIAATTARPAPIIERVLVVTIAEPGAVSVARQALTQSAASRAVATGTDKSGKDSKAANFWQQVKRVKQGEIFARKDPAEDERGLLGRAYSGLKQTLDKDKSAKQ